MQLARVIGTVVSTVKNESLDGRKFLIVQTLNADLTRERKAASRARRHRRGRRRTGFLVSRQRSEFSVQTRFDADRLHDCRHRRFGRTRLYSER
ncbi:MAG: EutN/CcmL family microcompartment protein [Pyrinomonadaceae bacterium]